MTKRDFFLSIYQRLTICRYDFYIYYAIFFLILMIFFISWPIVGYDTDLWYHLSGGKYFWKNFKIPIDAFFSYIMPQKSWYDYYWLFQVTVYKIYQYGAYYGLIVFRCAIFLLTVHFISQILIDRKADHREVLTGVFFLTAYSMALTVRELLVRPHLFSYLFIAVFIYILEIKREKMWSLPLLGVLWCNIHGIEYPVMIVIVLAYLADMFYFEIRNPSDNRIISKRKKWLLIATLYTVFITPSVKELFLAPFTAAAYQKFYISELIQPDINNLLRFSAWPLSDLIGTFQNVLILISAGAFVLCLVRKKLRLSHMILFVAAVFLLIKHNRFVYEYILLSLPLLRQSLQVSRETRYLRRDIPGKVINSFILFILLVAVPLGTYVSHFKNKPEYPVTQIQLPVGVSRALNYLNLSGNVMNEPNTGGYLQWMLNEKYKIFMDMQMSIFTDQDFAFINNALHDEPTFLAFVKKYNPSFISVSLDRLNFSKWINAHKEYQQIFFDDSEVLYINSFHYPHIAEKYGLKRLNVFEYKSILFEKETNEYRDAIMNEVLRVREIHPSNGIANDILARIMMANKRYNEAISFAEAIIKHYPNIAKGYILKADALRALEKVPEAIEYYLMAVDRGLKSDETKVYWNLHTCYGHMKMYKKAYAAMLKFINPFDPDVNYRDIYALGISAAMAGKKKDAENFLKIAQFKVSQKDDEYMKKIQSALHEIEKKKM